MHMMEWFLRKVGAMAPALRRTGVLVFVGLAGIGAAHAVSLDPSRTAC